MPIVEFKPFNRGVAEAPVGAFSSLIGHRLEQYKAGENITENAKEVFGLMPVSQDDQPLRNQIAEDFSTEIDALLENYDGAYESLQFQRDAKALVNRYAADPGVAAMANTMQETAHEDELRREAAKNPQLKLYNFNPSSERATTYTEDGGYQSYRSGVESAQNHLADAQDHIGRLIPNIFSTDPTIEKVKGEAMKDLWGVRQGTRQSITGTRIQNRADELIEMFVESPNGGNQLARKVAFDNGLPNYRDEDGTLNEDVRRYVADYLYRVGASQIHTQSRDAYQFPSWLNETSKDQYGLFGRNITNARLRNNPAMRSYNKIEPTSLSGEGLTNELEIERTNIMAKYQPGGPGGTPGLTEMSDEDKTRLSYLNHLKNLQSEGLSGYISSLRKPDGTVDNKTLEERHKGLFDIYSNILGEYGMTIQDALSVPDKRLLQDVDERVTKRYNSFIDANEVLVTKGYDLVEKDVERFNINFLGEGKAGFGRITNMGFIDREGNQLSWDDILERHNVDTKDEADVTKFKQSINLAQYLLPLLTNEVAQINISNIPYGLTSDEHAKAVKATSLSAAGSVLSGDRKTSDVVSLKFLGGLSGQFVADHRWDDQDNYMGNGVYFQTGRGRVTLDQIIRQYLGSVGYFNE